jgi:Holliday junction DNA helicase RuvB
MAEETKNRQISPSARPDERRLDGLLRPQFLSEFTGQERMKTNLSILIEAAQARGEPLDHVLFHGPPGLGKTTLAHIVANEMNVNIRITAGPAIERSGDLAAILTNLRAGDILFIDEVHRLGRAVEEILYPAMEDFVLDLVVGKGPGAKNVRLKLPRFTVIGATTRLALLTAPLRARFGARFRMEFYDLPAMRDIVVRGAGVLEVPVDELGADEIARRARGTPRVGLRLLRRVRDYAQVRADGAIDQDVAREALDLLQIDELGLDNLDRRVLSSIIEKFGGGPVGLDTIAASISEESDTIMDVVEPYLLQLGFLERTARGRVATVHAYAHLDLPMPRGRQGGEENTQPTLFDE